MIEVVAGVYVIYNWLVYKLYVGSSHDVYDRWDDHESMLRNNRHHSKYFQNSYNKYGREVFTFEILEKHPTDIHVKDLLKREQHYLDLWKPYLPSIGYNVSPTAGSTFGYKHTDETKRKMSESHKSDRCPQKGEGHPMAKLNRETVSEIREKYKTGNYAQIELGREYNVRNVWPILMNESWPDPDYVAPIFDKFDVIELNPKVKLTADIATQIRQEYKASLISYRALAKKHDVCVDVVKQIIQNRIWIDESYFYQELSVEEKYERSSVTKNSRESQERNKLRKYPLETTKAIKELLGKVSYKELSDRFGVPYGYVTDLARKVRNKNKK